MTRFLISDDYFDEALEALDENDIPYDLDGGDRIMIEDDYLNEAIEAWDKIGIEYDEI